MRKIYYLLLLFFSFSLLSAQEKLSKEEKARREKNIQAGNPFAKYGSKAPVATLSKGKYLEVHDLDSIVTIGTSRWHVDNKKIVGDIIIDSLNLDAQPIGDAPGRWMSPDPLSEEFSDWSPYSFAYNSPIQFNDPTGLAPEESDATKFDFNDGSNGLASTYVDNTGKIIKHVDDDDPNIYLVNDTSKWDGTNKGLKVIGQEIEGRTYELDGYLSRDDLFGNAKLPKGFYLALRLETDLDNTTRMEVSPLLGGMYRSGLKYIVYLARGSKGVKYVGITSQFAIRQATHLRKLGINIEPLLKNLTKADARAVEQVLIEMYKLPKNGGSLINKINSISKSNPAYGEALKRGAELLKEVGL